MTKLTVVLPVLALLTLGAFAFTTKPDDYIKETNEITFGDYNRCIRKLPAQSCDLLTDNAEIQLCQKAAVANTDLILENDKQLPACKAFSEYSQKRGNTYLINYKNVYINCFYNTEVIAAAEISRYYYYFVYAPRYLKCAGLPYQ